MKESIRCFIDPMRICPEGCGLNKEIQEQYDKSGIKGITRMIGDVEPNAKQALLIMRRMEYLEGEGRLEKCETYARQQSLQKKE